MQRINEELSRLVQYEDLHLSILFTLALSSVTKDYVEIMEELPSREQNPKATIAMTRYRKGVQRLEYLLVGDCVILVEGTNVIYGNSIIYRVH